MSYNPPNPNGQATKANSSPVTLPSDIDTLPVQVLAPDVGQGWNQYRYMSTASTNITVLKASAGIVGGLQLVNTASTTYWLKLYDKATAPVLASDISVMTLPIIGNNGGMASVVLPLQGIAFNNGISFAIVAGAADNNVSTTGAGAVIVHMQWI